MAEGANLKAEAKIKGYECQVVIDTGAARSMCSKKAAALFSLDVSGEERSFRGLGCACGRRLLKMGVLIVL